MNHYVPMFFITLLSGYLSTMSVWVDSLDDIRISLNDTYMVFLMTGWMFLFMGLYDRTLSVVLFGLVLTITMFIAIRTQFLVTEKEYLKGMIPHHSMAVLMSKRLKEKPHTIEKLLTSIIQSQTKEIVFMKERLSRD